MCGVIVVDAESFRPTCHGRDAYIHDHALDIVINLRFSLNCSVVICSPTVIYAIMREATSETYGPRVYFHHISFRSTILVYYFAIFIFQSYNKNTKNIYLIIFIRSHFCDWP